MPFFFLTRAFLFPDSCLSFFLTRAFLFPDSCLFFFLTRALLFPGSCLFFLTRASFLYEGPGFLPLLRSSAVLPEPSAPLVVTSVASPVIVVPPARATPPGSCASSPGTFHRPSLARASQSSKAAKRTPAAPPTAPHGSPARLRQPCPARVVRRARAPRE